MKQKDYKFINFDAENRKFGFKLEQMHVLKTKSLNPGDNQTVFNIWNSEYPVKLGFQTVGELGKYLATKQDLTYYLLKNDLKTIGWAMTFNEGDEKWFAITICSDFQRQGKGSYLLNELKTENENLNGWVIDHENDRKPNGDTYHSPLLFYQRNGFKIFPEFRCEIPILSAVKIAWHKSDDDAIIER